MNDAIKACDTVIETSDVTQVQDTALRIQPDFRSSEYFSNILTNGYSNRFVSFEKSVKNYFTNVLDFQNEAEMNNKNINNSTNFATDFNDPFKNGMYLSFSIHDSF